MRFMPTLHEGRPAWACGNQKHGWRFVIAPHHLYLYPPAARWSWRQARFDAAPRPMGQIVVEDFPPHPKGDFNGWGDWNIRR